MSFLLILGGLAACTAAVLLLHSIAATKQTSELLLDEYGKLLSESRERLEERIQAERNAAEEDEPAEPGQTDVPTGRSASSGTTPDAGSAPSAAQRAGTSSRVREAAGSGKSTAKP